MTTPSASSQQSLDQNSLDRSLFQTLLIAIGVGIVGTLVWLWMRHLIPRVYAPNLFKVTEKGKHFVGTWKWLRPMFTVSEDFLFYHRGMDALVYVSFLKMMLILMCSFFFFGTIILWPVDGTSSNRLLPQSDPHYVNGTAILTMSDIDSKNQASRFTAHLMSVIFNSVLCYVLFIRVWNVYRKYTLRQWKEPDFSNYSVLIDNVSRKLSEEEVMAILENQYPGEVLAVHRMMRAYDLHVAFRDRLDLDDLRSEAEWNIEQALKKKAKKKEKQQKEKQQKKEEMEKNNIGKEEAEGEEHVKVEQRKEEQEKEEKRPEMRDTDCVTCQACCLQKPKIDVLEYVDKKTVESNSRMEKLEKKLKATPAVMATFRTRDAAVRGASTVFTHNGARWYPEPATDWMDIRWANFEYTHRSRNTRYLIVLAIVFVLGIMFFIPITFAQGLANLSTLARVPIFDWLLPLVLKDRGTTSFIEGILPSLVITIAFALVKILLSNIVLYERYVSRSNALRSFTSKYFYLLVLNVFLASIAAGTFITLYNSVKDLVSEPLSIVRLLAQRLPSQANFFINYMAVNSVIGSLLPILQPLRTTLRMLFKHVLGAKTWNTRNWLNLTNYIHYHELYPIQMLYFTITIAYSSLAPLIVPFALMFFALNYFVSLYNLLYVYKRRWESFGKYWPPIFNRLCVSILIYQALMTGIFALEGFYGGLVVCAIFMIATIIYGIAVNRWYGPDLLQRSIETEIVHKRVDNINIDLLKNHYRDPIRNWNIINQHQWNDAIFYSTRDRLRQLQLSIENPEYYEVLQDIRRGYLVYSSEINLAQGPDVESAGRAIGPRRSSIRDALIDHTDPMTELEHMDQSSERGETEEAETVPSESSSSSPDGPEPEEVQPQQ